MKKSTLIRKVTGGEEGVLHNFLLEGKSPP